MFMIQSVSKLIFGNGSKESIAELPQGQFYIVRPNSPRGTTELIFTDAAASIRRTAQDFHSKIVVQRAFEEGEEELLAEEEDDGTGESGALSDPDEKSFTLDEELEVRFAINKSGETVFSWADLTGTEGDRYEFVCNKATSDSELDKFYQTALECQFERKHRKPAAQATQAQLESFIPQELPTSPSASENPFINDTENTVASDPPSATASVASNMARSKEEIDELRELEREVDQLNAREPDPALAVRPPEEEIDFIEGETIVEETAEVHFYDFDSGSFILQDSVVSVKVVDATNWEYQLQITSTDTDWMAQMINSSANPVFNFEFLSFIFNHYGPDDSVDTWLVRFPSEETLENFQRGFMQALWENANKIKWAKNKGKDQDYVLEAFQDLTMKDISEDEEEEEEEEEYSQETEEDEESEGEEEEEEDSEYEDEEKLDDGQATTLGKRKKDANSQLAVGYKHDRSFVVRGSNIGVFKHTDDNQLKLHAHIAGLKTPGGKVIDPKKIMLHEGDTNLILQTEDNENALYQMDLETGKVVEEWKIHEDIPISNFAPTQKFAQRTGEKTFYGLAAKQLYRVDPRLAGNKLVEEDMKTYTTRTDFSAMATTKDGHIAVGSDLGDIRLFDRLGVNAKTVIPALGDPIIGMDVSADGRYVLATTKTYILLIDTLQKSGKFEGRLGFERSFPADSKPQPRRLALTPSHVAQFQHETKAPISFTIAKFNTGVDSEETTIITSTGPFVVSWSLKKVLANRKDPYSIKRYIDDVKAGDFRFGSDKNMIVALPNEVNMIARNALKRPTRESIALLPSRKSNRRTNLWKTDIVDNAF